MKELPPSRKADQYVVRLPDGMRALIADAAKAAGRSMNAEIVHRLKRSFEADDAERSADAALELANLHEATLTAERAARENADRFAYLVSGASLALFEDLPAVIKKRHARLAALLQAFQDDDGAKMAAAMRDLVEWGSRR